MSIIFKRINTVAFGFFITIIVGTTSLFASESKEFPSVVAINLADTHSSYDTYPQIVEKVKKLKTQYKNSHMLLLFNGDLFETGNIVAKKSNGVIDLKFLKSLSEYATVILNVGNHEFDFLSPKDFLESAQQNGAIVIGNVAAEGMPKLKPYHDVEVQGKTIRIVGIGTDHLDTYPKPLREKIVIPEPVQWMKDNYAQLSQNSDYSIILSHAGLVPDLEILKLIKGDTSLLYMVGAHDHINIHQKIDGTTYMHNGFKGEKINVAEVHINKDNSFAVKYTDVLTKDLQSSDKAFFALIDNLTKKTLTDEDLAMVGTVNKDMSIVEAALWSIEKLKEKVGADAAFLNHTSFGSGLKKGTLPKYLFDQFMRFDNKVMVAEVNGKTLSAILKKCNQHEQQDIYQRSGDFLYTGKIEPVAGKTYKIVTSSWAALDFNQEKYFGQKLTFKQIPDISTKGILTEALK